MQPPGAVNSPTPNSATGDPTVTPAAATPQAGSHTATVTPMADSPRKVIDERKPVVVGPTMTEGVVKATEAATKPEEPDIKVDSSGPKPETAAPVMVPNGSVAPADSASGRPTSPPPIPSSGRPQESLRKELSLLSTARLPVSYRMLDAQGRPVKEQERLSYQNMIVRYGDWANVRCQVVAQMLLMLCNYIYRGHQAEIALVTEMAGDTVGDGSFHVHCCCPDEHQYLIKIRNYLLLNSVWRVLLYVILAVATLCAPYWERFIGRRRVLMALTSAGIPASIILMVGVTYAPELLQLSNLMLTVTGMLTYLITTSNLIEMLPYETRYLAVFNLLFALSVTTAISALHFKLSKFSFNILHLGIMTLIASLLGLVIILLFIKDSICHLNIRNEVNAIEKTFRKEEARLHAVRREGSPKYHEVVAKKVFEDIVYLDQDDLRMATFLRRIWKSFTMIEIVLGFFQAISAGIHQFEANHFINEIFADPCLLSFDRTIGYVLSGLIIYFLRKSHRSRVTCWLLAAMLFSSAARHAVVHYNERNRCDSLRVVKGQFSSRKYICMLNFGAFSDEFEIFSHIIGVATTGINMAILMQILLHFLESTPSILRPACILLIYMPFVAADEVAKVVMTEHVSKELYILGPVYAYHVLIIVLTMLRTGSKLPFSLYLFDLMPPSQREDDFDDLASEKTKPASRKESRISVKEMKEAMKSR